MSNKEEEKLLRENKTEVGAPYFEAPDKKILATGDMFRGPYTGVTSEIDLDNPGRPLNKKDELVDY
jgi:hypothetical protein